MYECYYIKFKDFCARNDSVDKVNKRLTEEKIFAKSKSAKRLKSRISNNACKSTKKKVVTIQKNKSTE